MTPNKTVVQAKARGGEAVTQEALGRAIHRGTIARNTGVHARQLRYDDRARALHICFDDFAIELPISTCPELAQISGAELKHITLGFAGRALCLEARDLHLSIEGLLSDHANLMSMARTLVASKNGSCASEAKAAAARENGRKGGRPRKLDAPVT